MPIEAVEADLRTYKITEDFDTVVSIGLLMFFDCPTAFHRLADPQNYPGPIPIGRLLLCRDDGGESRRLTGTAVAHLHRITY